MLFCRIAVGEVIKKNKLGLAAMKIQELRINILMSITKANHAKVYSTTGQNAKKDFPKHGFFLNGCPNYLFDK